MTKTIHPLTGALAILTIATFWISTVFSAIGSTRKRFETSAAMDIKPIRTKRDYEVALRTIESLMTAKRGTAEGDRLDILATLIETYEAKHFPLDLPDPVEANQASDGAA